MGRAAFPEAVRSRVRAVPSADRAQVFDALRDGQNGQVAPVADAAAVVSAAARYIRDPEMAFRHGAAARATAEAYGLDAVRRQWTDRLYGIVDRHAREAQGAERRRNVVL